MWCSRSFVTRTAGTWLVLALAAALMAGEKQALTALSLEQLLEVKVSTAALHEQSIARAPANVTVVTADEIRRYGYRTFGEVLNHVRGFYLTYDHTYREAGIGGFSIPGDWSTRVLVLVNGHNMTDNIFGSASYYDEDFVIDMSLVERLEIVRGTSSALYGSNGILATVNVITKKAVGRDASVRMETGTLGERRITATGAYTLPRHMSLVTSASIFNDKGQHDIYFPEYDGNRTGSADAVHNGHAIHMDGDKGYRCFADFTAGNWEILAFTGTRQKLQAVSWGETIFNDRGTRATDQHSVVEAT